MNNESDIVFASDERRELAYSLGERTGRIPLSGIIVIPCIIIYGIQLKFVPAIFSIVGSRDLGERMAADNQEILKEFMAGFRGNESPSDRGNV